MKLINSSIKVLKSLMAGHVFIGKNPAAVPAPAIILFPLLPATLNCGFAGLMTVKLQNKGGELNADILLDSLFQKVQDASLAIFSKGSLTADLYLGGADTLNAMEKALLKLKEERAQEFIFFQTERARKLFSLAERMKELLASEENLLETDAGKFISADLEIINSRIILFKDIQWALEKDILANIEKIIKLAGAEKPADLSPASFNKYRKLNFLLNDLDRLEVRGRDSAGLQISFTTKNIKEVVLPALKKNGLYDDFLRRSKTRELLDGTIFISEENAAEKKTNITFTFKTHCIVGELGCNVRDLRRIISSDRILQLLASLDSIYETATTHTRWASVGSITEENCHPVNNYTKKRSRLAYPFYSQVDAAINVVLNGDIDNYPALRAELEKGKELISPEVTTDTKIIPLQIEKYLQAGRELKEAFRLAVNDFDGSHAIAITSDLEPGKIFLALRGSGQSIYVGINPDQYMFSSELYGLVEITPYFIKMNGEASEEEKAAGQILILNQNSAGGLAGIEGINYDGSKINFREKDIKRAEITTRDIDRGNYPHYFLKEISEAALSVKRTILGKYRLEKQENMPPKVVFNLGKDIIPPVIHDALQQGKIKHINVIGHGTAAVAGIAVADALARYSHGSNISIAARVASELSGFGLKNDLSDTLIIPITQSGTTTDTNRAVAMAKDRGAFIISIVNRRQSDITAKSHGVFYTSDGRDIEMSVASTKAFYSQIIAGTILALNFAQLLRTHSDEFITAELRNLEKAPQLMNRVLAQKDLIARSVEKTYSKKFWAIVGSGPNKAAADEIRIKLSELCYRTISSDIVENKKHIDLSAEPLIIVCAAGNPEHVVEDIVKDTAIFKAHKAAVVVFAEEGDDRFDKIADAVIPLPAVSQPLPVILNTVAGHLWGYYAACSIDREALFYREFRHRLNLAMVEHAQLNYSIYDSIANAQFRKMINDFYTSFNKWRNEGAFDLLCARTVSDLPLLLKYAAGKMPLEDFRYEFKSNEAAASPLEMLDVTLGRAVDELIRPIDAIRHQAKTVTVGTSRKEKPLKGTIFDLIEKLKYSPKNLTYKNILTVRNIQPAVGAVRGYTLYNIGNLDAAGNPNDKSTIAAAKKGGVALQMVSRTDNSSKLMGTKRTIVSTGHVYVGKGKSDGAAIIIIPLLAEDNFINNLLLIHIEYNEALTAKEKRDVLGYRYNDICNLVNEYNIHWNDEYLEKITLADLLSEPVEDLALRIKQSVSDGN